MQPVYSLPLPDTRGIVVIGYKAGPASKASRHGRHAQGCQCPARRSVRPIAARTNDPSYPRVLNDPPYPPIVPRYRREQQQAASAEAVPALGSVTGGWAVSGDKPGCRINLSSTKAIGTMRASANGCSGKALSGVTGWRRLGRNGIELVQPGDKVVAKFVEAAPNHLDSIESADKLTLQMRR